MRKRKKTSIFQDIYPILLCILAIWAGKYLYDNNDVYNCLKGGVSEGEIQQQADELFEYLGYSSDKYNKVVSKSVSNTLLEYIQKSKLSHTDALSLPIYSWSVNYSSGSLRNIVTGQSGIVINDDSPEDDRNENIDLRFGPSGQLLEIDVSSKVEEIIEEQVRQTIFSGNTERYAKGFISQFAEIDTSAIELTSRNILQKQGGREDTKFSFKIKDPRFAELTDVMSLTLTGNRVLNFDRNISPQNPEENRALEILDIIFAILSGVVWFIVVVVAIYYLISRARRDKLDFVKIWWIGGFTMLVMLGIIISDETDLLEILLAGGLGGGIVGLAAAFVYSAGESVTREFGKEKLRSIDAIFQGKFYIKEIGDAVVKGVALSGAGLIILFLMKWMILKVPGTMITGIELNSLSNPVRSFFQFVSGNTLVAIFVSISMFLVWGSYLHGRIKSTWIKVLILSLFIALSEYMSIGIGPRYFSFAAILPLGILVAYVYFREEFLTVFVWIIMFLLLSRVPEFNIINPSNNLSFSIIAYGFLAMVYISGIVVRRNGVSISSFKEYVPEYAVRFAERQRIRQELEIAKKVQMDLLPHENPDYPYADIDTMCVPALEVGGDYFDFFPYDKTKLGLVIGDVSGKGVPAAFYMTLVKGILKTLAKSKPGPKDILSRLNQIFCENVPKNVFISAIYGVLDFEQKTLTFSRAGHMPLILCRKIGGEFRQITPKGMAIGLDSSIKFDAYLEEKTIKIEEGDLYLFFTDGISEANNIEGEEFGEERLASIIEKHSDSNPKKIIKQIYKEVTDFQGEASRHDDITAIAVKIAS
ncbi:SpoIIE family protein phosphatase [candidate division KSB1 bacterium]